MMYKVVFEYEDGSTDEVFVDSISEAYEYEEDENFSHIETV